MTLCHNDSYRFLKHLVFLPFALKKIKTQKIQICLIYQAIKETNI
ncbi:hypothetical protein PROSTU_03647 [Providencia stuartii ATCC 25827]|uniref:Uncharacterized protein n=1 Tax=Providencia stuartii ATCC 25827 TaxID=471874 RepID=A0AA86YP46_PROST|nr:hypothetical protein PROSTU_03647 [Providencia stuartii ATCC 25827]